MTLTIRPWLAALITILGVGYLSRRYNELDELPHLMNLDPDLLYEVCDQCPPDGGCLRCFDQGLVPHRHD